MSAAGGGFAFRSRVDVSDTDLGAVVYYGRYPQHVDRAVIAYRRALGIPPLGPDGHLFVVRSLHLDYRSSARFDDELELAVRTSKIGGSSHTVEVNITRVVGEQREPIADARQVIVGLDHYGGRPSRMPDDMRRVLCAFEGLEL